MTQNVAILSGLVYTIDKWEKNCSVRGLNATLDQDVETNMTMKRASGLFSFMEGEFVYQGKVGLVCCSLSWVLLSNLSFQNFRRYVHHFSVI